MALIAVVLVASLLAWLVAAASGIGAGSDSRTDTPRLSARRADTRGPVRVTGR